MKKLFLLGLLLATSIAFAMPTQLGFSGGFTVPTANIDQGIALTMTFDDSQNFSDIDFEGHTKFPLTQLTFNLGKSLEASLGFQQMEETSTGIGNFSRPPSGPINETFQTWNASLKYGLPWTIWKGKLAIGADFQSTSISGDIPEFVRSRASITDSQWFGLIAGTWPVFNKDTTFTTALLFSNDYPKTSYGFGLEKELRDKAAIGVEYIVHSPVYYHVGNDNFGTIYAKLPFGEMFAARLALTGINATVKAAASLTAQF